MSGSVVAEEEPLWMTTLGRGKPIRVWSPKVTVLADAFRPQTWRLTEPAQGGRIQSVLDPFYQRCPAYPELIVPPWHGDDRLSKATQKPAVARKERRTAKPLCHMGGASRTSQRVDGRHMGCQFGGFRHAVRVPRAHLNLCCSTLWWKRFEIGMWRMAKEIVDRRFHFRPFHTIIIPD